MTGDDELGFDDRARARSTVLLAGTLVYRRQAFPCRIRDLSAGGCRIDSDADFAAGMPVHLDIPPHGRFPAVVAWTEGRMLGLAFPEGVPQTLARFGERAAALGITGDDAADPAKVARLDGRE